MLTIEEITRKLTPIFEASGVTRAILFGSYAKGNATEDSDIDLVIETEPHVRGIWIYAIFGDVRDMFDIDDIDVDIFHRQDVKPGGRVHNEVAQTGMVIYER